MTSVWKTLAALALAGTMMTSSALDSAAPHQDIDGTLFLVNREWRVSRYYQPDVVLADVPGQVRNMREEAARALEEMYAAAKEQDQITLTSISGYRSYGKQTTIYNRKLDRVGSKAKADEYVARPGASEHQLGLAMDVGQRNKSGLTASFGSTPGGKWIREHCWEYGFILRYDEGWENVTGYKYEPWHVRYVGKETAQKLHENTMPLEEYLQLARQDALMAILLIDER